MIIPFNGGKVIASAHEVVIKLEGAHKVSLHAHIDALSLIGRGANVIAAHGSETTWSIKLDNEQQLNELASQTGLKIQ